MSLPDRPSAPARAAAGRAITLGALLLGGLAAPAVPAHAQTDYYNTDAGRPITVEDAAPIERHAFELQLAPVRLERARGGRYAWGIEPELAYGILPRTSVEIGLPFVWRDRRTVARRAGLAGLEAAVLHNLNTETRTLPALAVAAEVLAPVGALAAEETYASVKGIATRTWSWARVHVNGQYTFGPEAGADPDAAVHASRWLAGVAVDRTFPLRSLLATAELVARQPLHDGDDVAWSTAAGVRWQWSPRLAVDAGVARDLTGDAQAWSVTFGAAYAFAWRPFIPVPGR